eukprot:8438616-Pyramimonas_sp.AAC.1
MRADVVNILHVVDANGIPQKLGAATQITNPASQPSACQLGNAVPDLIQPRQILNDHRLSASRASQLRGLRDVLAAGSADSGNAGTATDPGYPCRSCGPKSSSPPPSVAAWSPLGTSQANHRESRRRSLQWRMKLSRPATPRRSSVSQTPRQR